MNVSLTQSSEFSEFVRVGTSAKVQTDIGKLLERSSDLFDDDGLSEEQHVVRHSVRQFAESVVKPVAESIHRNDSIVPDNVLDGVRDLGCFGLSVPAEFGGLKPGDAEDTFGMIVVTEELSRASLGAARSLITRPEIMVRALLPRRNRRPEAEVATSTRCRRTAVCGRSHRA